MGDTNILFMIIFTIASTLPINTRGAISPWWPSNCTYTEFAGTRPVADYYHSESSVTLKEDCSQLCALEKMCGMFRWRSNTNRCDLYQHSIQLWNSLGFPIAGMLDNSGDSVDYYTGSKDCEAIVLSESCRTYGVEYNDESPTVTFKLARVNTAKQMTKISAVSCCDLCSVYAGCKSVTHYETSTGYTNCLLYSRTITELRDGGREDNILQQDGSHKTHVNYEKNCSMNEATTTDTVEITTELLPSSTTTDDILILFDTPESPAWPSGCSFETHKYVKPALTPYDTTQNNPNELGCQAICDGEVKCGMYAWRADGYCPLYQHSIRLWETLLGLPGVGAIVNYTDLNLGSKECKEQVKTSNCSDIYMKGDEWKTVNNKYEFNRFYSLEVFLSAVQCQQLCSIYVECRSVLYILQPTIYYCHLYTTTITDLVKDGKLASDVSIEADQGTWRTYEYYEKVCNQSSGQDEDAVVGTSSSLATSQHVSNSASSTSANDLDTTSVTEQTETNPVCHRLCLNGGRCERETNSSVEKCHCGMNEKLHWAYCKKQGVTNFDNIYHKYEDGVRLDGHTLEENKIVRSIIECCGLCNSHFLCTAINYAQAEKRCELLEVANTQMTVSSGANLFEDHKNQLLFVVQ